MRVNEIIRAWGAILGGRRPALSIEVTRECPLRCPGCYAYDDQHLGGSVTLRELQDLKGDDLIAGVHDVITRYRPLHVSLVGGDPLVRYREMEALVPQLIERGIHVQLVTSAFRPMAPEWGAMPMLNVVVSVDGLRADHDVRRTPATYDRILKSIAGQQVTVHCTITGQMIRRPGYLEEFTAFWAACPDVKRLWFSFFTPQRGANLPEILTPAQRAEAINDMMSLRRRFPKIDMPEIVVREFAAPPKSSEECIFAQTTHTISADLTTRITPCQFGGDPDCSQCGCIASMGLAAIGNFRLGGFIPVGRIFQASVKAGHFFNPQPQAAPPQFRIIQ